LAAYRTAIELLPQLAALHLDLPSRQQILATAKGTTLASDAASCAVGMGQYNIAVEFLDTGRSIFWSQALHLQTPLDDLETVRPDLAAKLKSLGKQLELASFRDTSRNQLADTQHKIMSIESEGSHCRRLNDEWEETIKDVRILPGFEDFMRPRAINALKQAAVSGPIVILTASKSTCFTLIVTLSNEVQCVRLPGMTLPMAEVLADLFRALSTPTFNFDEFLARYEPSNRWDGWPELLARLLGEREGSIHATSDDVFEILLAHVWETVVRPVLGALQLQVCNPMSMYHIPLHLWG
jgi:hypothetical protein